MTQSSHLQPDGTIFPPVTPDPPYPPGYEEPVLLDSAELMADPADGGQTPADGGQTPKEPPD